MFVFEALDAVHHELLDLRNLGGRVETGAYF